MADAQTKGGIPMTEINVTVVSAEEADDGVAEFWYGPELLGITMFHEGRLHLRVESRPDGQPWLIDTTSLARGLTDATRLIAAY
jgi:hypothetical protein